MRSLTVTLLLAVASFGWVPAGLAASSAPRDKAALVDEWEAKGLNLRDFERVVDLYLGLRKAGRAEASRFLVHLEERRNPNRGKGNSALAETLMLFQEDLQKPAEVTNAFLHYVINTKYPILKGNEDAAVLKRLKTAYKRSILVAPNWDDGNRPLLTLTDLRGFGAAANALRYGRDDMVPIRLIPDDEQAEGYSHLNAAWMAEMSNLAYWVSERNPGAEKSERSGDLVKRQLREWGYSKIEIINDEDADTRGFVAVKGRRLVLCLKGTSGLQNFRTDADFLMDDFDWAPGRVHQGFAKALDAGWDEIMSAMTRSGASTKEVWVTGHSLGAALAQLAALRLKQHLHFDVRAVYTYGTPRVGNEDFVRTYDEILGDRTFPHVNDTDVVTRLAPAGIGFGYRRTANKQTREFTGRDHHTLRVRGEDPQVSEQAGDAASLLRRALEAITGTTRYLKGPEVGREAVTYVVPDGTKESLIGTHGSYEYLFKLACVVMDKHFWEIEKREASTRP